MESNSAATERLQLRIDAALVRRLQEGTAPGGDLRKRGWTSPSAAVEAGLHQVLPEAA